MLYKIQLAIKSDIDIPALFFTNLSSKEFLSSLPFGQRYLLVKVKLKLKLPSNTRI